MTRITPATLHRMLDSHGNPAVEAGVLTESGGFGRAATPNGASTSEYKAIELPLTKTIAAARRHAVPRLVDEVHAGNQREVDATLRAADGSENFSEIGVSSAIAISMATARAGADVLGAPLYQHLGGVFHGDNFSTPLGSVIGSGGHAKEATSIQEFLAAPVGAPSVSEAVFANTKVRVCVSEVLDECGVPTARGDEDAWAPPVSNAEASEIIGETVSDVEGELDFEIGFGLDIVAPEMFENGVCHYGDGTRTTDEQTDYVVEVVDKYDLAYVEDPFDENNYEGFAELTEHMGDRTLICGGNLFVTNVDRLQDGIDVGATNSILIKPSQIGTLTNAFDAVELASRSGMDAIISHRSSETEDATTAYLAIATDAPLIRTNTVQSGRTAKLNELIRIADDAV